MDKRTTHTSNTNKSKTEAQLIRSIRSATMSRMAEVAPKQTTKVLTHA